jgi:hypothetical protein
VVLRFKGDDVDFECHWVWGILFDVDGADGEEGKHGVEGGRQKGDLWDSVRD